MTSVTFDSRSPAQALQHLQGVLFGDTTALETPLHQWSESDSRLRSWREPLADAILEWVLGRQDFSVSKRRVNELAFDIPESVSIDELVELRRTLSSIGFFSTSPQLLSEVIARIFHSKSPVGLLAKRRLRANIATGQLTQRTWIGALRLFRRYSTLHNYITLLDGCDQNQAKQPTHAICGPAPLSSHSFDFDHEGVTVCRVMMPGVCKWDSNDQFSGRSDIAYLNGMTANWVGSLSDERQREVLASVREIRLSSSRPWTKKYTNARLACEIKPLYLTGSPNMVPTMVVDQLIEGAAHIYIVGTSFFLGKTPYRQSQRREFQDEGKTSDRYGSIGTEFERCRGLASHDQLINRAIVKNLHLAGRLSGDQEFERTLSLSDYAFTRELEETYGRDRR